MIGFSTEKWSCCVYVTILILFIRVVLKMFSLLLRKQRKISSGSWVHLIVLAVLYCGYKTVRSFLHKSCVFIILSKSCVFIIPVSNPPVLKCVEFLSFLFFEIAPLVIVDYCLCSLLLTIVSARYCWLLSLLVIVDYCLCSLLLIIVSARYCSIVSARYCWLLSLLVMTIVNNNEQRQ